MPQFKTIDYGKMIYETLRAYFAVNSDGNISLIYKFIAAVLQPLQAPFDNYDQFRINNALIASCKWQIGQLTNVLNYLYDKTLHRIFITQSSIFPISDPIFAYPAIHSDSDFGSPALIQERVFGDRATQSLVTINIPNTVNVPAITATVEQIKLQGIPYIINVI